MSETRPWGAWHILDVAPGYKVKRIEVNPNSRLSYQSHQHRAEHWVVVSGVATCTVDGVTKDLQLGESILIAQGSKHRIANLADTPLAIIEVQIGSYTGEDDIIRYEDDYGRSE